MSSVPARSSRWLVLSILAAVAGCGGRGGIDPGSPDGSSTGAAGAGSAGATGSAGFGAAGDSGAAGTSLTGQAGAGGTCGPVCDIYCRWGNVSDAKGCPTCQCKPAPACQPSDCKPVPVPSCASGHAACARNDAGDCELTWSCPACPTVACATKCAYGNKVDANGCETCECNPSPTCTAKDCGPAPGVPSMMCGDGSIAGPVCGPTAAGTCGWTITKCPPTTCQPVECLRACPNGSVPDANGCPTCNCIELPACSTFGDYKTCISDMRCQWLQPGCGDPALATGGCYARTDVGCTSDTTCSGGRQCLSRVVDPCYDPLATIHCHACGATQTVCL